MRYALLTLALLAPLSAASAQGKSHGASVTLPDELTWGPAPAVLPEGAKVALLEGNPNKPGPFTMRLQMPDGYQIAPHYHPGAEHVTVVSGALNVGMGTKFDESAMKTLPAGSFGLIPARMRHYAKAQGETVLQLHGTGPWRLIYVNKSDDPRKRVATQ